MIINKKGNILNSITGHVIQCINCQGVMGAGLAKAIADRYPKVYEDYKEVLNFNKLYPKTQSKLKYLGSVIHTPVSRSLTIHSIFGQLFYGRDGQRYVDYKAMMDGFDTIKSHINKNKTSPNEPIYIPHKIGCGLAGGSWSVMSEIIELCFDDYEGECYIIQI